MRALNQLSVLGGMIEVRWHPPSPVDNGAGSGQTQRATTPMVLLHEGLGSVSMWRSFPEQLASSAGREVIAYSRFGHGRSTAPAVPLDERFMHREAMATLPAVLDAADLDRVVLFGHSDGGSIALIFAATYPQRTAGLVLEAPHVFVEDVSIASIERMKQLYATTDLRARLARHHDNVDAAFHGWNDVWLSPQFRAWNIETYLPRVTCPILLIQGEQDEYGSLAQVRAIERGVTGPIETDVLPDCGHSPHRDQTNKVLARVSAFALRHNL